MPVGNQAAHLPGFPGPARTVLKSRIHQCLRLLDDFVNHCLRMSHEENNHLYYIQSRPREGWFISLM